MAIWKRIKHTLKLTTTLIVFYTLILTIHANAIETVNIGVLAHKNYQSTKKEWLPTTTYLNHQISGYEFHIIPLGFNQFPEYIRDKKIDFIVTNSAYYVDLEHRYGISRVATLKNMDFNNKAQIEFGSVIFIKRYNKEIENIKDLKNKSFAAVDANSFGGWIMALGELKEWEIAPNDLHTTFYQTHEAVVYAVLSGKAAAGTVRTDTLERMASEGKININDFAIINQKNYSNFFYKVSTKLYPEWPFAKARHTSDKLAEKVAVALISMPQDSEAAKAIHSFGWTIPLDYQSIHELLKELGLAPYAYLKKEALSYFLEKYMTLIVLGVILIIISITLSMYIAKANIKLKEAKEELHTINDSLEEKVYEKTEYLHEKSLELEKAYKNEKYFRGILRTVADVNQILITTNSIDTLLDKSALCLSLNNSFKSAKICIVKNGMLELGAFHGEGDEKVVNEIERNVFLMKEPKLFTLLSDNILQDYKTKANLFGITAIYALPLKSSTFTDEITGVLSISTALPNGFNEEEQNMLQELAGDIGFAINSYRQKEQIDALHKDKIKSYQDFIEVIANMIEQRDAYTAGHSMRVSKYASLIAKEMGFCEDEIRQLTWAAKLHDLGKIVTPDSVLLKPSELSELERELIKEHVSADYKALSSVHFYKELADIVVCHHERYDGNGYPFGKKGDEISISGYILSIADSFDAMTTNRIYKPRKGKEESLKELESLSGSWYHPQVVKAALTALNNIEIDISVDQLAKTPVEEERLSYFFKDRLTRLYNEDYFTITRSGRTRHKKPQKLYIISLIDFANYNKKFTWEGGNRALIEFTEFLNVKLPNYLIFRIWGDHFAIADFDGDINELLKNSPLVDKKIAYKIREVADVPDNPKELMAYRE